MTGDYPLKNDSGVEFSMSEPEASLDTYPPHEPPTGKDIE